MKCFDELLITRLLSFFLPLLPPPSPSLLRLLFLFFLLHPPLLVLLAGRLRAEVILALIAIVLEAIEVLMAFVVAIRFARNEPFKAT